MFVRNTTFETAAILSTKQLLDWSHSAMANHLLSFQPSALLLCALTASCGPRTGTDVGNGATVSVNLRGYDKTKTSAPLSITLADGAIIEEFWVVASRLGVRPSVDNGCKNSATDEEKVEGPLVANLAADGFLGDAPVFDTAPGGYCRFRLDIGDTKSVLPGGAPDSLKGASIYVRGIRADGVPFEITSRLKTDVRLDASKGQPFSLPEGESGLFVAFPLDEILIESGIALAAGSPVVVDDKSEPQVLKDFEQSFRRAAGLFRDENADGELDLDEAVEDKKLAVSVP